MRFTLFVRKDDASKQIEKEICDLLLKKGTLKDDEHPEIVICIGGDGTFLRAVHNFLFLDQLPKFVCVRSGSLCFFGNYEKNEVDQLVDDILNQTILFEEYPLLQATIHQNQKALATFYAVNEIRIENPFKTMICDVDIDNERLEEFRGNGLLVSSTLGSSAYNKSCGGALIDTKLNLLELTEIAPIESVAYRSIKESMVLASSRTIRFYGPFKNHEVIGYDYLLYETEEAIDDVTISYSDKKIQIVKREFVSALKKAFIGNEVR